MSERITRFLAELSRDPQKAEEFWEDPGATLDGADLTDDDREIIRAGDAERLRDIVGFSMYSSVSTNPNPRPARS